MKTLTGSFIPVLPIRNTVLFPGMVVPLLVGRAKSVAALERARAETDGWLLAVLQKPGASGTPGNDEEATPEQLHRVGTLAKIERVRGKDRFQILVRGITPFAILEVKEEKGALLARGEQVADRGDSDTETTKALLTGLKDLSLEILQLLPAETEQLEELVRGLDDLPFLANLAAGNIELPVEKKQELLETRSVRDRVLKLLELMQKQKESLEVQGEIREKHSHKMGKLQREAFLREQMKTIREELGDGDEGKAQDDFRKKIDDAGMPEDVRKVAIEELKRLEAIGAQSPESHVIRNYLELLCAMPWKISATAEIDLDHARATLEGDHYGLDKVKRRILQHLAVMKLTAKTRNRPEGAKGSILLLVGPPGVGKTSLGQSIAKALGRKFARGALGGVRDDAEIRGHRRTYVGAMPGRIVQGLKRAGQNNPVFILDEVDKLGRGYQGDPAGALLEVLDPEQNATFTDHYLDVPFDLSKVFFIATANTLETIPGPLLDRMEVIELTGYTTAEKLHIAKRHLIPKQLAEHGLSVEQLAISDEALLKTITHYTREAGVRELQRSIATICRASTEKVLARLEKPAELPVRVEVADLDELLGPERFSHELAERIAPPGVVTGLAWTPHGGEILFIESSLMPGTGKLTLTGQLGEVMKESAQIALSLVRAKLPEILPGFEFDRKDLHIHVPAGAIPKDGPSAGIALLTAVASLYSGRNVNPKVALTGEITLRGAVMPVGGIKEKVIAAHRAGITRVLLPKRNQKDLRDVPAEIREGLKIEFVETVAEVLMATLGLDTEANLLVSSRGISTAPPAVA